MKRRIPCSWSSRSRGVAALVVVGLLAGSYGFARRAADAAPPLTGPDAAKAAALPAAREARWVPGNAYVYDLRWSGASRVKIPGAQQPISVTVKLEATLTARAMGEHDGLQDVVVSLSDIRTYDVQMQGKPMFDDAARAVEKRALMDQEVLLQVDRHGTFAPLGFDPKTPARVRQVLARVIDATRVSMPPPGHAPEDATWDAEETTPTGLGRVRYQRRADGALLRKRLGYASVTAIPPSSDEDLSPLVEGGGVITLDGSGAIAAIDDHETVTIESDTNPYRASSSFGLTRLSVAPAGDKGPDLTRFVRERVTPGAVAKPSDESIVQGMTPDRLLATVVDYDRGASLPRGFMVNASAYGRLHPESSRAMVKVFVGPTTRSRSRTLIMDLLAATGDPAAQDAMRDIVRSKAARADAESYAHYLQRFMLLPVPERASAELLFSIYAESRATRDPFVAEAAAVPLGAMARKLRVGEPELSARIHQRILDDLGKATSEDDRIALLKALGNGAFPNDVAVIVAHTRSGASHVRDQAAFSLRSIDADASRAALLALTQDPNRNVATTAVRALRRQSLSPEDWTFLRTLVVLGKTNRDSDADLVALLVDAESDPGEEARPILQAIQARARPGSDLRDRTQLLLADAAPEPVTDAPLETP
jgi:hypothetical protein